jgi:hypoxanthine phosphoribosyltransferase
MSPSDLCDRLAAKIEGRFDLIVGIPRGGLIVAAALGYRLDARDVGAFSTRYRRGDGPPVITRITCRPIVRQHSRVLVVEDGTASGTLLEHARRTLEEHDGADVTTAALWVSKGHGYRPDVWVEEVDTLPSGASLLGDSCG